MDPLKAGCLVQNRAQYFRGLIGFVMRKQRAGRVGKEILRNFGNLCARLHGGGSRGLGGGASDWLPVAWERVKE